MKNIFIVFRFTGNLFPIVISVMGVAHVWHFSGPTLFDTLCPTITALNVYSLNERQITIFGWNHCYRERGSQQSVLIFYPYMFLTNGRKTRFTIYPIPSMKCYDLLNSEVTISETLKFQDFLWIGSAETSFGWNPVQKQSMLQL